jgi:murein L,D-transpeptidase YafK
VSGSPRGRSPSVGVLARKRGLAAALLAICACLALLAGLGWMLGRDRIQIETERTRRLAYAAMGVRLPGTPDLGDFDGRLAARGLELGAPVFLRIFKLEFELEVWMKRGDRFERFATYPICRWSGVLGPKLREGDWQAPEGFYTVDAQALNPASRWHRSFNLGFPNALDRAHGRTGSYLMVHGGCSSIGCFAMTDAVIDEVWRLVTAALKRGQRRFHVHIFPFRMTDERMAQHSHVSWAGFWRDLKPGYDLFEATGRPPTVSVCRDRYTLAPAPAETQGSSEIDHLCAKATDSGS